MTSLQPHDLRGTVRETRNGLVVVNPGRAWSTLLHHLSNAHLPDPDQIDIGDVAVSVLFDSDHRHHRSADQAVKHARQWADSLGLVDFRQHPTRGIYVWSGWLHGEHWMVTAYTPDPADPNDGVTDAP